MHGWCFNAKENDDVYSYFTNIDYVLAEVHDHEKWPLPDKHGCTAISMEADIQESWVWSHSKGLIWKSALGSGCSEQEENGLQTGESDRAKAGILSVPIPPQGKVYYHTLDKFCLFTHLHL